MRNLLGAATPGVVTASGSQGRQAWHSADGVLRRRLAVWLTVVAAFAATLVGVSGSPAQAVVWSEPGYLKTASGRCLQAVSNGVRTAPCNEVNNRASFKWRMEIDGKFPGLVRFLLNDSAVCLDSNNVTAYHTLCEADWIGQYWHGVHNTSRMFLWGNNNSRFLTGWDAGNVSMEPRGTNGESLAKQVWSFDPV
ncbi:hypothetical protein OG889_20460 [Streptomyces sp. NBC_00481]|uniref:hypothetical protein n=1 Tax=unclassified Streptomyces TaxID=2593676 RepID=UPI002DDAAB63|nr:MULTISPECIES: hypothetical protein [unclassified Streptomyces]WRY96899.1 hypothetical protein OG889_20460 [Streptomyces sp. NBC_00481]